MQILQIIFQTLLLQGVLSLTDYFTETKICNITLWISTNPWQSWAIISKWNYYFKFINETVLAKLCLWGNGDSLSSPTLNS